VLLVYFSAQAVFDAVAACRQPGLAQLQGGVTANSACRRFVGPGRRLALTNRKKRAARLAGSVIETARESPRRPQRSDFPAAGLQEEIAAGTPMRFSGLTTDTSNFSAARDRSLGDRKAEKTIRLSLTTLGTLAIVVDARKNAFLQQLQRWHPAAAAKRGDYFWQCDCQPSLESGGKKQKSLEARNPLSPGIAFGPNNLSPPEEGKTKYRQGLSNAVSATPPVRLKFQRRRSGGTMFGGAGKMICRANATARRGKQKEPSEEAVKIGLAAACDAIFTSRIAERWAPNLQHTSQSHAAIRSGGATAPGLTVLFVFCVEFGRCPLGRALPSQIAPITGFPDDNFVAGCWKRNSALTSAAG